MYLEPKVSILMGVYNCADTIKTSIDSIISQSYKNWELIICDDNSSDNTCEIVREFLKSYGEKIKLIINSKNLTLGPTLNHCLKYATGKYIARQDGDDYSHKNRLEIEVEYLENNKDIDLVSTNMISFSENGEEGLHSLYNNFEKPNLSDLLAKGAPFAHATIMMRKEVIDKLNGYTNAWYGKQLEDYELWFRFLKEGYIGINLNENLYYVRENRDAFKRRSVKRRLRGIVLNFKIFKEANAPLKYYIKILRDIIAIFIPSAIFEVYYKRKLQKI